MSKRILIAEDDAFLNKMYKLNLEREEECDVRFAENGEEAIIAMDEEQPELLLLDLLMPKVDGFAVLEHIREKGYDFPVIILSNLSQEIDQQKCMELGAKDYFVKSDMDLDELLDKVKRHLR